MPILYLSLFLIVMTKPCLAIQLFECGKDEIIMNRAIFKKKVPNQGHTGTCVSHSIAQVYTSLIGKKPKTKKLELSPIFVALHNKVKGNNKLYLTAEALKNKKTPLQKLRSGNFFLFFKEMKKSRICSPKVVEDFLYRLTRTRKKEVALQKTFDLFDLIDKKRKKPNLLDLEKLGLNFERANTLIDFFIERKIISNKENLFSLVKPKTFKKQYLELLYEFFNKKCMKEEKPQENLFKKYDVELYDVKDNSKEILLEIINENMTKQNNLPIGISFHIKNLYKEGRQEGRHSSIIIGKICDNNKRYYIIRNSWGGLNLNELNRNPKKIFSYDGDFLVSAEELLKTWTDDYGAVQVIRKI